MRVLLLIALVAWEAACSAHGPAGPSWPRPATREADGGETLAPRPAARAIAAIVEEDRAADRAAADRPAAPAAAPVTAPAGGDRPAATPAAPPPEDPLTTEEIVIEVDD